MDPAVKNPSNLTANSAIDDEPEWSPDGKKIAFIRYVGFFYNIFVMNADGTGQQNITNMNSNNLSPVWSPNSKKIIFSRQPMSSAGYYQLYLVDVDGTGITRLWPSGAFDRDASWWGIN